ncbi:hypothetical protein OESDEN_14382 [Oesophagostomum dentatum]|uniref:Fibrinogen C-terminal domain-containing protein n=1 Tax=Oesophagostomum dentatum TaxID=61180 RepID=A0A0B1SQS7_OESDE|nr:hypothetical protein OESDEN_14382 [Oesophagostomum dentatum]
MADKTFKEYIDGFGNPLQQQVWLGLDLINGMTNYENTSLRVNLYRCPHNGMSSKTTYCTYDNFAVLGAAENYAVIIPRVFSCIFCFRNCSAV